MKIMRPETVGLKQSVAWCGKPFGRHRVLHKLEEMGYKLGANQLEDAFVRMKALADRKTGHLPTRTSRRLGRSEKSPRA